MEAQQMREKQYQKAVEKAAVEAKMLLEDEDKSLLKDISAVKTVKEMQQKKEAKLTPEQIALQLKEKQKQQQQQQQTKESEKGDGLVFTATTEFVRAIQPIEEILAKPKKKKAEKEIATEVDIQMSETLKQEEEEKERMIRQQADSARKKRQEAKEKIKEEEMERQISGVGRE